MASKIVNLRATSAFGAKPFFFISFDGLLLRARTEYKLQANEMFAFARVTLVIFFLIKKSPKILQFPVLARFRQIFLRPRIIIQIIQIIPFRNEFIFAAWIGDECFFFLVFASKTVGQ